MRPNAPVLSLPRRQGLGLQLMTELVAKLMAVLVPAGLVAVVVPAGLVAVVVPARLVAVVVPARLVAVVAGPCLLEG